MWHAFTQELTNLFVMNNYATLMLTPQCIALHFMFICLTLWNILQCFPLENTEGGTSENRNLMNNDEFFMH